jgi:hypothetical protein
MSALVASMLSRSPTRGARAQVLGPDNGPALCVGPRQPRPSPGQAQAKINPRYNGPWRDVVAVASLQQT